MNSNKFKCCGETANPDSGISVYDWAIKDNKDIIPKNKLPEFYSKDEVDLFIRDIEHDEVKIINGDWYINGQYAGRAAGPKGDKGDPGDTPYIQNDYWYINGTNTLIKAVGLQGPQGKAFTYEDFTEEQLLALKGDPGKDGKDGTPGANGKDGNQTEYIYALSSSETAPNKPSSLNIDNYCPVGWSTVPQQISKLYKFLYISSRNKINGVWGDFSIPVLFSRYAERGSTGGHYEFRYKNSEKQPTKPIGNGIGNGWTREPSTPTDGKFTWMSQALCQDDDYGEWSEPIRITGDNGKNGEDGKSFEFIYINYTPGDNGAYPSISYNTYIDNNGIEQNPNNDDFVPRGWTDNPTGVSEKNQYEWFSTREKVKGVWSLFSFPVIWSKWGERGQDGDGYEYIYLLSNIEPDNPTPSDYETNNNYLNLDEYVKLLSGWTDEPQGVSEEYLIEWVSVRRRKSSKWLPFSKPAEWARWSSKGTDGGHWVFAYIVSKTTPLILPDGSDLKGWTYEMPENVDRESGYGIYMTLCFVSSSGVYSTWSTPIRISGEDGRPGTDGNFTEFIYTRTTKDSTAIRNNLIHLLELLTNSSGIDRNENDFIPDGWFDHPQGVDDLNCYEWVSTRTRKGTNTWEDFSTPSIWSKWGEKGMDGDGYEYVFFITPERTIPELNSDDEYNGKTKDDDEYLPYASETTVRWTDDPQDVSEINQYEWVSVRKKHKGVWGEFEDPKLWTRWAPKGIDGDSFEYIYHLSNKSNPKDITNPTPDDWEDETSIYQNVEEYVNELTDWSDDPQSPNRQNLFVYVCKRTRKYDSNKDKSLWTKFSDPSLWARWAEQGESGGHYEFRYKNAKPDEQGEGPEKPGTGTDGYSNNWTNIPSTPDIDNGEYTWMTQCYVLPSNNGEDVYGEWTNPIRITGGKGEHGADGTTFEFIYTRNNTGAAPITPTTSQEDDYIPSGWTDNPAGVTASLMYEYVSTRSKSNGIWSTFSIPVVWSKWGEKGMDGDGYEYIFKLTATNTNPGTPTNSPQTDDYIPEGWTDDPESVTQSLPYQWCSVRKKTNGTWGTWSIPAMWARYAEQGETGGHYEFRYKNSSTQPAAPTGTGLTDGWAIAPTNPDINAGIYTWMSQSFVTPGQNGASDSYGTWTTPIRITGGQGEDGADGTDIEFVYTRNNTGVAPNTPATSQVDDYVPTGWTDNPQGVQADMMYEYVSMRYKRQDVWTAFTTPAVWSKWGEKGMDGDGYEYIYKLTATADVPTNPTPANTSTTEYQTADYVPIGWSDDPGSVSESTPYQWVCVRERHNGTWGVFSTPALWSRWATQGASGGHYEFRYKNSLTQPNTPTGTGESNGWSRTPTNPTESEKYTWMSQTYVNGNDEYGTWTTPIRITGLQGEHGADGTDIEFIYTRNNTGTAPAAPTGKNNEDDWSGTVDGITWTDNPQGVEMNLMYEYVSTRTKKSGESWSDYSTPVIWSKWGEKGMDGDGYEYIYKVTQTYSTPSTPSDSPQTDDFVPTGWTDDPAEINQSNPYQWVSVRKKNAGTWGSWSAPVLWSRYAEQGETGGHYEFRYKNATSQPSAPTGSGTSDGWAINPSNPDIDNKEYTWMSQCYVTPSTGGDSYGTWSTPIRITGGEGKDGADGTDIEFVYSRNNTGTAPAAPVTNQTDDWSGVSGGVTWTDNPQGVQSDMMYEYVSVRYKINGTWSAYSTPVVWSKWGEKGMDGDGYEYIYKLSKTAWENDVKPPYPTDWETSIEYQKDDYKPSGWSDDPQSISADMPYLYVCVRKKKNGVWQEFSNAKLWLHWAEGVPGPQGDPGSSPYFADIDNEMDSVACDLNGYTVENYDAYIYVHVWHGSKEEDLTKLTVNNSITNFTITPDKDNKRIRVRVSSGTQIAQVNKINITVASANSGDKSLHFVLNGVRAGANGNPAIVYSLVPSVSNVIKKKDSSYSVYNVSCTRLKNVGGVITDNTTDGTISYKLDDGIENYDYVNNKTISVTKFSKSIQFIFRVNGTIVDVENIPMISDGIDSNGTSGGNDAVNVSLSPEEVIVTQSTTYPYNIDLSNAKTVVSVNEGGVPKTTFSITNITGMYCTASNTENNTIKITGIDQSGGTYYDNGYVTFDVIYNGKTYNKRFNFYANLLGTWKRSVEAGVETVVAGLTQYLKDDNGNIITSKSLRNDINNATQDLSTLSKTVTTQDQTIRNQNTRLSTAEQNVSSIQRNAVTRNLLSRGKWFTNDINYPYADYDAANDRWYDGDHSVDDIYSPVVNLKKGKYCFYGYIPSSSHFDSNNIQLTKGATSSNPSGTTSITPDDAGGISTDTIEINNKTYERWYAIFDLNEDSKCSVNLYGSSNESDVAVPCLCEGEHPNIDSSTSMIKQTADEINLAITNKLGETGINIDGNTREINLIAGKVNFKTSSGGVNPYISITNDGKIKATDGEFSGEVTANSGTIGGFTIDPNRLYNDNWNASIDINYDGKTVKIGKKAQGESFDEDAIIRAENTKVLGGGHNTALYLNASGATYNYAFYGNGNGVLNGLVCGYKVQSYTIKSVPVDTTEYLDIIDGSTIILKGSRSGGIVSLAAPILPDVMACLGINNSTIPFAIEFTVINHSSYGDVYIIFRDANTGIRYNNYLPWLMDGDDNHVTSNAARIQIARGDVVKIMLVYDNVGTTSSQNYEYRAYDLIRRYDFNG